MPGLFDLHFVPMEDPRETFEKSQCAEYYRKYRHDWTQEVIETIVNFLAEKKRKPFSLAVAIGCGTGQSSGPLAPYFDTVIGIDRSNTQLQNARVQQNASNIEYRVGSAEKIPLPNECADVITCGHAVHWVNFDEFNKEVNRVLKPGGCIAVYGDEFTNKLIISDKAIEDELNKAQDEFTNRDGHGNMGDCKNYAIRHLENDYTEFTIPYEENKRMNNVMVNDMKMSVKTYTGIYRTFATYWTYLQRYPDLPDPVDEYEKRVMGILRADTSPEETFITRRENIYIHLGRKPL